MAVLDGKGIFQQPQAFARIIKGRPFDVGFECGSELYRKVPPMDIKYIGMDIHKEAIVIAVVNGDGKMVMESIIETKASTILQYFHGLRGELHVKTLKCVSLGWLR